MARNLTKLLNSATAKDVTLKNYVQLSTNALYSFSSSSTDGNVNDVLPEAEEPLVAHLDFSWQPNISNYSVQQQHKELSRKRKQTWNYKTNQNIRFEKLFRARVQNLGAKEALEFLCQVKGAEVLNYIINSCIEKARNADDKDTALEEFHMAYMVIETMRQRGFEIKEETYGPFLMLMIDMGMVEAFRCFCDNIKKDNPKVLSRLAYYETLLWRKIDDEDKTN